MRIIIVILLATVECLGQRTLTGRVLEEGSQRPLKNVNIVIFETTTGTFTNHLGFFQIDLQKNEAVLVLSHVGYLTSQIEIPKEDKISVVLKRESTLLPLLDLTAPIQTVNANTLNKQSASNSENFIVVESNAAYPGGLESFFNYVKERRNRFENLPKQIVGFDFTVDETGYVHDFKLIGGDTIDNEIVNDLKSIIEKGPKWEPATQRQIPVTQSFTLPVKFSAGLEIVYPEKFGAEQYSNISKNCQPVTGFDEFYKVLNATKSYPKTALKNGYEGVVFVTCIVDEKGQIIKSSVGVLKGLGGGIDEEASRLIKSSSPWTPAKSGDANVRQRVILPIEFRISR
jgi:periplasmic protein TonB